MTLRIVYFGNSEVAGLHIPVREYIDNISNQAELSLKKGNIRQYTKHEQLAARLMMLIIHTAQNDGKVSMPHGKKLYDYPFSELRQKVSKTLVRIFYFVHNGNDLILLHAYNKSEGSPTPLKELEQAHINFKLYQSNPNKHAFF